MVSDRFRQIICGALWGNSEIFNTILVLRITFFNAMDKQDITTVMWCCELALEPFVEFIPPVYGSALSDAQLLILLRASPVPFKLNGRPRVTVFAKNRAGFCKTWGGPRLHSSSMGVRELRFLQNIRVLGFCKMGVPGSTQAHWSPETPPGTVKGVFRNVQKWSWLGGVIVGHWVNPIDFLTSYIGLSGEGSGSFFFRNFFYLFFLQLQKKNEKKWKKDFWPPDPSPKPPPCGRFVNTVPTKAPTIVLPSFLLFFTSAKRPFTLLNRVFF